LRQGDDYQLNTSGFHDMDDAVQIDKLHSEENFMSDDDDESQNSKISFSLKVFSR